MIAAMPKNPSPKISMYASTAGAKNTPTADCNAGEHNGGGFVVFAGRPAQSESDWRGRVAGCGHGFNVKNKRIDLAHYYRLACGYGGGRDGVPEFAVDENLSARRKRSLRDAGFTDQSLSAGDHLVAARFESDAHQECRNQAEWNADGERREQVDAHFRDWGIDEK